jgi:hypothetical protein
MIIVSKLPVPHRAPACWVLEGIHVGKSHYPTWLSTQNFDRAHKNKAGFAKSYFPVISVSRKRFAPA